MDRSSVLKLGLCDVETRTLRKLCAKAKTKPSTISVRPNLFKKNLPKMVYGKTHFNLQLNLASCCVVPPDMQQFAEENGIRLVTHNDPEVILGEKRLGTVKENKFRRLDWVVRYQVI